MSSASELHDVQHFRTSLHSNLRFLADPASSVIGESIDPSRGSISGCCDMRNANADDFGFARFRLFEARWFVEDIDGWVDVKVSRCVDRGGPTGMAFDEVRLGGLSEVDAGS